jgi:hypothetical protein
MARIALRELMTMPVVSRAASARAAYVAAALNLAAALAMLLVLRPGLPVPGGELAGRFAYITAVHGVWWGGWLLWQAAALGLLAFYVGLAAQWAGTAPLRCLVAVLCATAGIAADISAEALYMALPAQLGAGSLPAVDAVAGILTGYVGNGLYTVGGLLLIWAGACDLPRPLLALSVPVWLAGLALSATTLAGWSMGPVWSTAALMPLFVLWSALMGRWLSSRVS